MLSYTAPFTLSFHGGEPGWISKVSQTQRNQPKVRGAIFPLFRRSRRRSSFKFDTNFFPRSFCFSRKNLHVRAKASRSFWCRFSLMIFCQRSGCRRLKCCSFSASRSAHTERSSCVLDLVFRLASLRALLSDSIIAALSLASLTILLPSAFASRMSRSACSFASRTSRSASSIASCTSPSLLRTRGSSFSSASSNLAARFAMTSPSPPAIPSTRRRVPSS